MISWGSGRPSGTHGWYTWHLQCRVPGSIRRPASIGSANAFLTLSSRWLASGRRSEARRLKIRYIAFDRGVPLEGPQPMVYGLAPKGARLLREHGHHLTGEGDWTEKNKRAGAVFLEHTLAVANFTTAVELSCRARPDIDLVREHEILADAPPRRRKRAPRASRCAGSCARNGQETKCGRSYRTASLCCPLRTGPRRIFCSRSTAAPSQSFATPWATAASRAIGDVLRRLASQSACRAIRREAEACFDSD